MEWWKFGTSRSPARDGDDPEFEAFWGDHWDRDPDLVDAQGGETAAPANDFALTGLDRFTGWLRRPAHG